MKLNFLIGDFAFSVECHDGIMPPPNFMKFKSDSAVPSYHYSIELADSLPAPAGEPIAKRADIEIFQKDSFEYRLIGVKGRDKYYAFYEELSENQARVLVDKSSTSDLNIDPVFTSLLALERRLLPLGGLVLHCAYIVDRGEAILFSAPSETGKTTQANLWKKYRSTFTVNGDRALLQCLGDIWTAQGWPVCGTSDECSNLPYPIKAIVMLSQGKEDYACRMSAFQAFPQLYSQITVNGWNRSFVESSLDLIGQLLSDIPVYHLSCTISENAVKVLEGVL